MSITQVKGKYAGDTAVLYRGSKTIATHVEASVPAGSYITSDWHDADGYDKIAITLTNDSAANSAVDVDWSHDGKTPQGKELNLIPDASTLQRAGITETKARYFRVILKNRDSATAHVMSAFAYLKA
jgi:hypothetical protein